MAGVNPVRRTIGVSSSSSYGLSPDLALKGADKLTIDPVPIPGKLPTTVLSHIPKTQRRVV